MAEFIVPSILLMGLNAGESGGIRADLLDPVPEQPFSHSSIGAPATEDDGDTAAQQPAALARILRRGNTQASRQVNQVGDTTVTLQDVSLAGVNASAVYIVAPSDIGNGNDKIPQDQADVTLDVLSLHPNVFFRAPERSRHIASQQEEAELLPITDPGGPLQLFQVDRAPTYSSWVFVIDGTAVVGWVQHPAGSDIRRPRDIWNDIIVPALTTANGQAPGRALALYELNTIVNPGFNTFQLRGYATRMQYLQYARFNGVLDEDPAPILTPVYGTQQACPSVTGVAGDTTPDQGTVGNVISLTGTNFLAIPPLDTIEFGPMVPQGGGVPLTITNVNVIDANNADITFDVPPGAQIGQYNLLVCGAINLECVPGCAVSVPAVVVQQSG